MVSCFDGISAMRRGWQLLGLELGGFIAIESSPLARRVVVASWPHVVSLEDVLLVTAAMVTQWRRAFPHVKHVILCGGFPCQNLSRANATRKGMDAAGSQLAWVFRAIWALRLASTSSGRT